MIGIYKITSPSGRVYIGQSTNLKSRLRRYKNMSIKTQGQTKIWRSLKKYGAENHKYQILHECSIDMLNELERYYQEQYDCVENGLNCHYTKTNDKSGFASNETKQRMSVAQKKNWSEKKHPWSGRKHKEETKLKISIANSGRKYSKDVNKKKSSHASFGNGRESWAKGKFGKEHPRATKVMKLDLDGNFICSYDTVTEAAKDIGGVCGNISSCCRGNLKTYYGFRWSYE